MPTNVTPEYKKAKAEYQRARDPKERLQCLKEMLRLLPKHKGTDHLQAEIKTKIKELTAELASPRKGARTGPVQAIRPEGAAQIAFVGPPNSGKSSLHARLTGSHAEVAPYPNATHAPLPGMLSYEDIQFQLVDLPPVSATFMETWMPNALQQADAVMLVVDLATPGCVENVVAIRSRLDEKRVGLIPEWPGGLVAGLHDTGGSAMIAGTGGHGGTTNDSGNGDDEDPFRIDLPTMVIATKIDLGWSLDEIDILEELVGVRFPALAVSNDTREGLDRIGPLLFKGLDIVRVYTKIPGHPPDTNRPFTVFRGATIYDVAKLVHREMAESVKFARVWGSAKFDGQQVGRDHVVADRDAVELHT